MKSSKATGPSVISRLHGANSIEPSSPAERRLHPAGKKKITQRLIKLKMLQPWVFQFYNREIIKLIIVGSILMFRFSTQTSSLPTTDAPLRAFISYSRRDMNIADRIVEALEKAGIEALIDRRDLPVEEEWQEQLADMIRTSDTVIWLVSDHSINSDWCQWELATLVKFNKRLVPIQVGPMSAATLPEIIGKKNVPSFIEPESFGIQIQKLVRALLVPFDWVKDQNWLADQASRSGNRLRGPDLRKAEQWLREKPDFAETPTEKIQDLIAKSRRLADRNKTLAMAASVFGMFVAVGVAWYSNLQWQVAQIEESRALALASSQTTNEGDAASGLLLALKGLPNDTDFRKRPLVSDLQRSIYQALFSLRETTVFEGHSKALTYAETSENGSLVLTSSADGTARLWSLEGNLLLTLDGHNKEPVNMARLSPDASLIVTVSNDRTGILWDRQGEKIAELDRHKGPVLFASFSDDGRYIVTTSADYVARLWSAEDGRHLQDFEGHEGVVVAADFNPDGTMLATASVDRTARIWSIGKTVKPILLEQHEERLHTIEFDPTGAFIATTSRDRSAIIWTSNGELVKKLDRHEGEVKRFRFAPHAPLAVTASDDNTAKLWNTATGNEISTLHGHNARVIDVDFSADGSKILTASVDGAIGLWRLENRGDEYRVEQFAMLRGHEFDIASAMFSADGEWVISSSKDHTARLWRATEGQNFADSLGHDSDVRSFAFSNDGQRILTANKGDIIKIWNARTRKLIDEKDLAPRQIISTAFSSDGSLIALAHEDGGVSLHRTSTLSAIGEGFRGHEARVRTVDFSSDDTRLVTSSADGTARVWDVATGQMLAAHNGHEARVRSAIFSPDDKQILTVSADRTARLWDSNTGNFIKTVKTHEDEVWAAAFSPDGAKIVTGSEDGQAFITELAEDGRSHQLVGHDDNIRSAEFSPDGRYVLTSSWDRTVRLWDAYSGDELAVIPSEDIVLDAAFDPSGKRIAHLVKNQVRFRPIYPTVDDLIAAAKTFRPREFTSRERRLINAGEQDQPTAFDQFRHLVLSAIDEK